LRADPGIKKDGTQTQGNNWQDGKWTRFYQGLPRSIPGYRSMTEAYPGPSRGLFVNLNGTGYLDIFSGSSDQLVVGQFTTAGFGSGVTDITPAGFVASPNNVWQMDSFFNSNGGGETDLIAHAGQNLTDISNDIPSTVYYGDITSAIPLIAALDDSMNPFQVSGGIAAIHPYVIAYGSNGLVAWSDINNPALFPVANQANPTSEKIVKGMSIRGGGASPSALLWSIDSVLQMSFVGGDQVWNFQILSDQSSILSSSAIVEMDGVYYWPGIDRWLTFNGVLRELPNEMNLDFFYSNLNFVQRQKVFGFKVPRWGEIWWCFPLGTATECNHAVIYNVRENTWYDTPLPSDGRSAAYFAQSWQYPIMFGATVFPDNDYQLWQHEFGVNEIQGTNVNAIESFIESPDISMIGGGIGSGIVIQPQDNSWTELVFFEPDFLMGPNLTIQTIGRQFSMDDDTVLDTEIIIQKPTNNFYALQCQARYVRWRITSNIQDGYFVTGQPMFSFRPGDKTP
jgi:hypothetical protein